MHTVTLQQQVLPSCKHEAPRALIRAIGSPRIHLPFG